MRILLTGGTGLVGTELGIALTRAGHEITALTRRGNAGDLPYPASCLAWDHSSPIPKDVLSPNGETFDAVIHLAGEPVAQRWTPSKKRRIYESRITSTRVLIKSLSELPTEPSVWLNASAIGIYGDTYNQVLNETSPSGTGFLSDVCRDWEGELKALSKATRGIRLRFGIILSNEGGALPKMLMPFRYGLGGPIGSGSQAMSWVHLDDVVSSILHALNTPSLVGPINIVAPTPVSNRDFTRHISKLMRLPAVFPVPILALRVVLGEMSHILFGSSDVRPTKLIESGFKFKFPDLTSALTDLLQPFTVFGARIFVIRQWIKGDMEVHSSFFSAAENLEKITPPWLHFKIIKKSSDTMSSGVLIDYKLRMKGIPLRWRTRIESWNPPKQFVDVQLRGPYKIWHHTHLFEKIGDGTLITDRVVYKMLLWPFGDVAIPLVTRDIRQIFAYRKKIIESIFKA